MRKFHRWAMTVFAVFLLYVAASGVLLNWYDYTDDSEAYAREGGGRGARTPTLLMGIDVTQAEPLTYEQLSTLLSTAVAAAKRNAPGEVIASMEFHLEQGAPIAIVNVGLPVSKPLRINAVGEILGAPSPAPVASPQRNWHGTIKSWHRGLAFGPAGATMVFITGCVFLTLCLTGIVMYFNLWSARRRAGRSPFFWS